MGCSKHGILITKLSSWHTDIRHFPSNNWRNGIFTGIFLQCKAPAIPRWSNMCQTSKKDPSAAHISMIPSSIQQGSRRLLIHHMHVPSCAPKFLESNENIGLTRSLWSKMIPGRLKSCFLLVVKNSWLWKSAMSYQCNSKLQIEHFSKRRWYFRTWKVHERKCLLAWNCILWHDDPVIVW